MFWLVAIYFIAPKFNLVNISGAVTGVRVEDLCVLVMGLYLLSVPKYWVKIDKLIFFFLLVPTISFFLNIEKITILRIMSYLRLIEYFVLIQIIIYCIPIHKFNNLIYLVLWVNIIFGALQIGLGLPGFASIGLLYELSRAYGLTGGAWELGAFITVSLAFLYNYSYFNKQKIFWLSFMGFILSGSRSQFPVFAYIALKKIVSSWKYIIFLLLTIILFGAIFRVEIQNTPLISRMNNVFNVENLTFFYSLISESGPQLGLTDQWEVRSGNALADESWSIRASKWSALINYFIEYPYMILVGLGPGALGDALDGGFLRAFSEYGIFYGVVVYLILKSYSHLKFSTLAIIVYISNMLLIDIHLSSKVAPLIILMAIYQRYEKRYA
jgi:hypothetical protein